MTRKTDAKDTNVDWNAVELATEIARTYEVELFSGGIIFKQYKPSFVKELIREYPKHKCWSKWKSIKLVGVKA